MAAPLPPGRNAASPDRKGGAAPSVGLEWNCTSGGEERWHHDDQQPLGKHGAAMSGPTGPASGPVQNTQLPTPASGPAQPPEASSARQPWHQRHSVHYALPLLRFKDLRVGRPVPLSEAGLLGPQTEGQVCSGEVRLIPAM